jgi:hypothetical protein
MIVPEPWSLTTNRQEGQDYGSISVGHVDCESQTDCTTVEGFGRKYKMGGVAVTDEKYFNFIPNN